MAFIKYNFFITSGKIHSGSSDSLFIKNEPDPVEPYTPLFTDNLPITGEMKSVCGEDSFCLLDLQVTGKNKMAAQTRVVNTVNTENKINIGKENIVFYNTFIYSAIFKTNQIHQSLVRSTSVF